MTEPTLESRLEEVEKGLAELRHHLLQPPVETTKGILSIAGTMTNYPEFDELVEHGKYIRRTGQLPPPDWKPGDPIPGPDE